MLCHSARKLSCLSFYQVSEITVTRCMVNPSYSGDYCSPESTNEEDSIKGKWVRVPRNLNREGSYVAGWLVSLHTRDSGSQPYAARRNYTTVGQDVKTLV
jgi:hypothetical protein